jgi:hypothetical protein
MLDRVKFWWLALRQGIRAMNSAAGWLGLVVLTLGVAAGIALPLVFHVSHWLTAVIVMAVLWVAVLEGSYRVWAATDRERKAALAQASAKRMASVNSPTFWDVQGATLAGNEITNTYNAPGGQHPSGKLVAMGPGTRIIASEVSVEYGPPPPLPDPLPSTPEERTGLRDQLLELADTVEAVMAPWGQSRQAVAAQMDVPPDEFMTRMPEILSERSRINDDATARYKSECRSAVVQAYGHARSIGIADADMERLWRTRLGAGGSKIPERLRAIACRISV